jgi:hypothetical protein
LEKLRRQYEDRAEFLLVVVREARHPISGLEFLLKGDTSDWEQRRHLVAKALQVQQVTMPVVLDTEDAQVERAYLAWPLRLVLVRSGGQLAFDARFRPDKGGLDLECVSRGLEKYFAGEPIPPELLGMPPFFSGPMEHTFPTPHPQLPGMPPCSSGPLKHSFPTPPPHKS